MVDYDNVLTKLKRGAFVGLGTFASSFIGNAVEDFTPVSGMGVALAQVGVGAGVAVGTDMALGDPRVNVTDEELVAQAGEFMGYGVIGAGFAELAESVQTGVQTGQEADRIVTVRADSGQGSNGSSQRQTGQSAERKEFSLDTA